MRLSALHLPTQHFEEYLSFLTEVLELDLSDLTDSSMRLALEETTLIISKTDKVIHPGTEVGFDLSSDDYSALVNKLNFYYYRRGPTRFLFLKSDNSKCHLIDPDGRLWIFSQSNLELSQDHNHFGH